MARPKSFDESAALCAAMEAFREKGYEATSLTDLTERMGIERSSLYGTFGDKRTLFLAALERYQAGNGGAWRAALAAPGPARGALRVALESRLPAAGCGSEKRYGCLCVNSAIELAGHDPEVALRLRAEAERDEAALVAVLERGKAQGEFPRDLDCGRTARLLGAVLLGLSVLARTATDAAVLAEIVDTALAPLGAA